MKKVEVGFGFSPESGGPWKVGDGTARADQDISCIVLSQLITSQEQGLQMQKCGEGSSLLRLCCV